MKARKPVRRSERGQSLIEFAFSLVVLLVLLAGAVDGGRALFTYLSMRDAAQEGALYASINPSATSAIVARVRESSNMMNGLGAAISVEVTPTVPGKLCAGTTPPNKSPEAAGVKTHGMNVRIEYPHFPLTMPFIGPMIGSTDNTIPISVEVNNMIIIPKCDNP